MSVILPRLTALLVALGPTTARPSPGALQETRYFRVLAPPELAAQRAEAAELCEAVAAVLARELGTTIPPPVRPHPLRLYRDWASFREATKDLEGSVPEAMGFSQRWPPFAHVSLSPDAAGAGALAPGLSLETRRLIAHEACHVLCFARCPDSALHPSWFTEGLACVVADQTLRALDLVPALEEDPFTSTELVTAQELLAQNLLPRVGALLADRKNDLDFRQGYAVRWSFYEFLRREQPAALARWTRVLLEPGRRLDRADLSRRREEIWPYASLERLDAEYLAFLRAWNPRWKRVTGLFEAAGPGLRQWADPKVDAVALRTEPLTALPYTLQGHVLVQPLKGQQLHLLLGKDEGGFYSACFVAGFGVTLLRYDAAPERWSEVARAPAPALQPATPAAFRLEATTDGLRLALDGEDLFTAELDGASLLGAWGLGAQAGSAGEWRALEVTSGSMPGVPASAR